jgi:hypothetical protein
MPFGTEFNWVQHEFEQGQCLICGLIVPHDVSGLRWSVEGAIISEPPTTNWTACSTQ